MYKLCVYVCIIMCLRLGVVSLRAFACSLRFIDFNINNALELRLKCLFHSRIYAFQPNARHSPPCAMFCIRFSTFLFFCALIFSIHFALKMYSPETSDSIFRTSKPYNLSSCQFIHALGKLKCQCWLRSLFSNVVHVHVMRFHKEELSEYDLCTSWLELRKVYFEIIFKM